jgi:DNA-binding transcriptional ArsR family regulator
MAFEAADAVDVSQPPADRLELTDPRAMRALAHPTRLALLEHLHVEGSATATQLAGVVGESPSACSYHLRALARWGLVEEAPGGRGRNRPWRLAARSISFSSTRGSAEQMAAASLLRRTVLERDDGVLHDFFDREHELPPEWQDAAGFGSGALTLTLDELNELSARFSELLRSYHVPARRPDTRRVEFIFRALPQVD